MFCILRQGIKTEIKYKLTSKRGLREKRRMTWKQSYNLVIWPTQNRFNKCIFPTGYPNNNDTVDQSQQA